MLKNYLSILVLTFNLSVYAQESKSLTDINTSKKSLNVDLIWGKNTFRSQGFGGFSMLNDGKNYTEFIYDQKDASNFSLVKTSIAQTKSVNNHSNTELFNSNDLMVNNQKIRLEDFYFNAKEDKVMILTNMNSLYRRSYTTDYYVLDLKTKKLTPLADGKKQSTLATFSPDGSKVAFLHENNLFVKDLVSNDLTQVTHDGLFNHVINGTTDWVYEEEFAITEGFSWSHDGKYISFLKFDESKVKEFTMQYFETLYPRNYTFKYPKAGEDNSKVSMHIYSLHSGTTATVPNLGEYEYIPRFIWSPVENKLILQTLNRHQNHVKYQSVDVVGSTLNVKVFYEEKSNTYIDIDDNISVLNDGKSLLRTSEVSGYNHIYRLYFDGKTQQITKGNWDVIDLYGLDESTQTVFYSAAVKDAIYKGVYSIGLTGKNAKALTLETGYNEAQFTVGMKYFVNYYSTANSPNEITLRDAKGNVVRVIADNHVLVKNLKEYVTSPKEFIKIQTSNVILNASIIKPANFDVTKKYPVYVHVYGGPGSNLVLDKFSGNEYMYHQLLAQSGYIVLCVDPRGTQFRGQDFKKQTYLQLGKYETEDLIATAKYLGQLSYVDSSRIGVMGWSYGGYMTSLAMTKGADYFKMGIAVAPVTNWKYYDNIYTERFMRTPAENEAGYEDNSPINHVDKLKGKYFLIHGAGDDNVHFQNAMEMFTALIKANKAFDQFTYPNKDHGIYGGNTRLHLYNMMYKYTLDNL